MIFKAYEWKPYLLLHDVMGKGFTIGLTSCFAIQICYDLNGWSTWFHAGICKDCTARELQLYFGRLAIRLIAWKRMRRDTCYINCTLYHMDYVPEKNGFDWVRVKNEDAKYFEPVWVGNLEQGGIYDKPRAN